MLYRNWQFQSFLLQHLSVEIKINLFMSFLRFSRYIGTLKIIEDNSNDVLYRLINKDIEILRISHDRNIFIPEDGICDN